MKKGRIMGKLTLDGSRSDSLIEDLLKSFDSFSRLTPKNQSKVILFTDLLLHCPGFKSDYKAATSEGPEAPTLVIIEALMDKWISLTHGSAFRP